MMEWLGVYVCNGRRIEIGKTTSREDLLFVIEKLLAEREYHRSELLQRVPKHLFDAAMRE